jgi:tetratricopeptide (TPR) repeat protein
MRPLSPVLAIVVALLACAQSGAQTSSALPRSPEEALQQLRYTQAPEADWSTFPDFTSVAMKNRVREENGEPVDNDADLFLERKSDGTADLMLLANGHSTYLPAHFDRPELDASKATFLRQETISAAGKKYEAKVYSFDLETKTADNSIFMAHHLYWLAAGVPGGVVRHESTAVDSGESRKPGGVSVTVLADLDVPFTIQEKVLHAYCYSTQIDWPDATSDRTRVCKHGSVPGGIVRLEQRELKNGVEVRFETTDLEEVTLPPKPGAPTSNNNNSGCAFPESLLGDVAQKQMQDGDFKGAISSLDTVVGLNPACARAYNDRGYARLKLGDNVGALSDLNRATELSPSLTQAYVNRAVLKRDSNDLKGALAECNAALKIDPKFFNALVNRMVIYFRLFEDERALKDYKAALEVSPSAGDSLDRVVAKERKQRGPRP